MSFFPLKFLVSSTLLNTCFRVASGLKRSQRLKGEATRKVTLSGPEAGNTTPDINRKKRGENNKKWPGRPFAAKQKVKKNDKMK